MGGTAKEIESAMNGDREPVRILRSVPITDRALEDVAQIVNALNECLGDDGIWAEVVGEGGAGPLRPSPAYGS